MTIERRFSRYRMFFARNTRFVVRWITTFIAVVFTGYQARDIILALISLISLSAAKLIWAGALVIYVWCWRFGCIFDTDLQERAYVSMPNKGRWRARSYRIVAFLVILAILLCLAQGNILLFSLALTAFFVADYCGWRHLISELEPEAKKSASQYRSNNDYFALEQLRIVSSQVGGTWKNWRLSAGAIIILIIDLFALSDDFRSFLVAVLQSLKPTISETDAVVFAYSLLVLSFVAVMEIWHFSIRLMTKISIDQMDTLSEKYRLQKLRKLSRRSGVIKR